MTEGSPLAPGSGLSGVAINGLATPVSNVVLGVMNATPADPDPTFELLDAYVGAGGNMVDTAHVYGAGAVDRTIGRWLAARGRDAIMVLAKGCHPADDGAPRVLPAALARDLSESLDRLNTDYVDLYLLHRDDPDVPVGALVEALNGEREAGRVRAFGASNWGIARIAEANTYAAEHGLVPFAIDNPGWSLAVRNEPTPPDVVYAGSACREWHRKTQLPLAAWAAQACGFFSGRYRARDGREGSVPAKYYSEENFARLRRAEELAVREGVTPNAIAVAYLLNQPFPTLALVGPGRVDQLLDSLLAAGVRLTESDVAYLEHGTLVFSDENDLDGIAAERVQRGARVRQR